MRQSRFKVLPSFARPDHVVALDGLRGFAAIAVMARHLVLQDGLFSHGYLAVDFFFVLSGYVIGLAYEERLRSGLSFWRYMWTRIRRLWPMLLVGAVLGAMFVPLPEPEGYFAPKHPSVLVVTLLAQVFGVPFIMSSGAFILNFPQWSIMFELIANAAHALLRHWLTTTVIGLVTLLSGLCLIGIAFVTGSIDVGWGIENFVAGFPRVFFGFFAGLFLFRTQNLWHRRTPDINFWILGAALLLALGIPHLGILEHHGIRDVITAIVICPLLVALGAVSSTRGTLPAALGVLSYPLYALHNPLIYLLHRLLEQQGVSHVHGRVIAGSLAILIISLLMGYFVDRPLQRRRRRVKALARADSTDMCS